jgi:hypothetical protein
MQRSVSVALLGFAILVTVPVQAQRGGAMFHGGGPGVFGRPSPGIIGRGCCPFHPFPRHFPRFGTPAIFVGGLDYPFWYDEPSGYEHNYEPAVNTPGWLPPSQEQHLAVTTPVVPLSPKIIDVPGAADTSAAAKPRMPVLFVLANGDRLEAHRYTLTADFLYVDGGGQRRKIPLAALDRDTTVAVNHQRGIDLRFPSDPNEILLGF